MTNDSPSNPAALPHCGREMVPGKDQQKARILCPLRSFIMLGKINRKREKKEDLLKSSKMDGHNHNEKT